MKILLAADDTPPSSTAASWIATTLSNSAHHVDIVSVRDQTGQAIERDIEVSMLNPTRARETLGHHLSAAIPTAADLITEQGLINNVIVTTGHPEDEILRLAAETGADLVVIGTHDRGALGRLWHGSVSARLLDDGDHSVLVTRDSGSPSPTVLIGVDNDERSLHAAAFACELFGDRAHYVVCNVTVMPVAWLGSAALAGLGTTYSWSNWSSVQAALDHDRGAQTIQDALDRTDLPADSERIVAEGTAITALIAAADEHQADVIVVGTSDPGLYESLIGGRSVARGVANKSDRTVLVVR